MFSIRWMVKNTEFRFFTAYSDTEARELGTIYQACNFTYLGTSFGARMEYRDPKRPERGWFSDRLFRRVSQYQKHAERLGYTWRTEWGDRSHVNWEAMPELIQHQLKTEVKRTESECEKREVPKKHKYVYVLGRTQLETLKLRKKLSELHPELAKLSYPKNRGPKISADPLNTTAAEKSWPTNFAATLQDTAANISRGHLKVDGAGVRPQSYEDPKFLPIKDLAVRYCISEWILYRFIKTDPTFPYLNVGIKKKFVINETSFRTWMEERTKRERSRIFHIPTGQDLLKRSMR